MFACAAVACPDGLPASCASPAPTRTHRNALSCMRAWSATSEAIALSVRTDLVLGGVLGALRDAVLGSSRASTPVGRSQARVADQISLLDVRTVFGDGSLLAALSPGARGCALCAATSQPGRGASTCIRETIGLKAGAGSPRGASFSSRSTATRSRRSPGWARSTASAIARAAGAGGGADAARGHCRHLATLQLVTGVRRGA
jgi:hypothetical protein